MRRAFLVAVAAGLLAACRLFVDVEGLGGGAAADAGIESLSPEGSTTPPPPSPQPDGSPDAADASDAGDAEAGTYCTTVDASLFCDSFDQGDTTFAAWSFPETKNSGALALATTNPKSPPGFLRASVGAGTAGTEAVAALNKSFGARSSITWAADVRVVTAPSTASLELLEMYDDTTNSSWAFFFDLDPGGISMDEEYANPDGGKTLSKYTTIPGSLGTGTWHRIAISANFTSKAFSVSLDGLVVATGTFAGAPAMPSLRATAGISWTATPTTGGVIDMDNVTAGD